MDFVLFTIAGYFCFLLILETFLKKKGLAKKWFLRTLVVGLALFFVVFAYGFIASIFDLPFFESKTLNWPFIQEPPKTIDRKFGF